MNLINIEDDYYLDLDKVNSDPNNSIWSTKSNKYKTPKMQRNGYWVVQFTINSKNKIRYIHRIIAALLVENPNNLPCVNHIDEVKTNNLPSNLEWCTKKYNVNYGTALKRRSDNIRGVPNLKLGKPVYQYDMKDNLVATYPSLAEAQRQTNIWSAQICRVCKGLEKQAKGYKFTYKPPISYSTC